MDYYQLYEELLNDIGLVHDITGSNHEYVAHEMLTDILEKHDENRHGKDDE